MTRWRASAPLRIDLAGGTLDIWPLYLLHPGASTVNVALQQRALVDYTVGGDRWRLHAVELDKRRSVAPRSLPRISQASGSDPFALVLRAVAHLKPPTGGLRTRIEGPIGGGLGGSSALLIACCGALIKGSGERLRRRQLIELARDLEAQVLSAPTGVQDYYPAVYGGVQQLVFGPGGTHRRILDVDPGELERRLVLVNSGVAHASAPSNWKLFRRRIENQPGSADRFAAIAAASQTATEAIEASDWKALADAMNEDWRCRARLDPSWVPPVLAELEAVGRRAGAAAAKGCGAASGGCMVFLVREPRQRPRLEQELLRQGVSLLPVKVARTGLKVERRARTESQRRPSALRGATT